jgi:hypothetical protein
MAPRRTPLVASGFLAGALLGALPPVQMLPLRWQCASEGGRWRDEVRACEPARAHVQPPAQLEPLRPLPPPRHGKDE